MKYLFLFILLTIGVSAYYLYHLEKSVPQKIFYEDSDDNLLSKQFWIKAAAQDVKKIVGKKKKLHSLRRLDNNRTPLHYAVKYGKDIRVISILINAGVNPLTLSKALQNRLSGRTALHLSVLRKTNAYEWTKELLQYYPDVDIKDLRFGATPLILAANNKSSPKVINLLLEKGANINTKTRRGSTALMSLAMPNIINPNLKREAAELVEIAQIFLDYKADIAMSNDRGRTALDYMAENEKFNKTDFFKQLSEKYQYKLKQNVK